MDRARWERLAPLAGIGFTVLVLVGSLLQGSTPDFMDEPGEIVEFYTDDPAKIFVGMNIAMVGVALLVWFLASLRRALLVAEGGDGRLSALAYGAGVAASTLLLAGFALNALGALRGEQDEAISEDVAVILNDGSSVLLGFAAPIAMAVLLAATALAAFRFQALPAWLGWVSVVLAVVGLIGPISWILLLIFPLWVLVTSVLLYRTQPPSAMPATGAAAPTTP